MVWFIVVCAIGALIAASFAAIGKLGAMPDAIEDTYAPTLPADRTVPLSLSGLRFGRELRGYLPSAVDEFLSRVRDGDEPTADSVDALRFPISHPGYSTAQVDDVLDRLVSGGVLRAIGGDDAVTRETTPSESADEPAEPVAVAAEPGANAPRSEADTE